MTTIETDAGESITSAAAELLKAERPDLAAQLAPVLRAIDRWRDENRDELLEAWKAEEDGDVA